MEDGAGGGSVQLVGELNRIQGLLKQLEAHLDQQPDASCRLIASELISLTERSLGMVRCCRKRPAPPSPASSADIAAPGTKTGKKRKTMPKKSVQMAANGDAAVDDGHSWRKYGQKEILGSKHPRGYFRCTHRKTRGCLAVKQVQRTDNDPSVFDVVYYGEHVCGSARAQCEEMAVKCEGFDVPAVNFVLPPTPAGGDRGLFCVPSPVTSGGGSDVGDVFMGWRSADAELVEALTAAVSAEMEPPAAGAADGFLDIDGWLESLEFEMDPLSFLNCN